MPPPTAAPAIPTIAFDFAPWRLSGTIVGVLLNDRDALAALGDAAHAPPYRAPPRAPVLYLKPRNTLALDGATVALPPDVPEVEIGAAVGVVLGRAACRVAERDALACIAGLVVVADLSVPHVDYYRPSVRLRARDGFCPIGTVVPMTPPLDLDDLVVHVAVDGRDVHRTGTRTHLRGTARLIADVTEFLTLAPGDVLLLGTGAGAPRAGAGQAVAVTADGIGTLRFRLAAESAA
jgi:5-oxopent-3-ene-1,2,5-tricarboxylate decarboxylase / 2-hydroxyhepta-2,4-diene-1,7-dioate isomerase